jgi:hypothetical protein
MGCGAENPGCPHAARLRHEFAEIVKSLVSLRNQQYRAIMRGVNPPYEPLDSLIAAGLKAAYAAEDALINHLNTHGCLGDPTVAVRAD